MSDIKPDLPGVAAPENALVGDEGVVARDADVEVVREDAKAQVTGPPAKPVETVKVHETYIKVDEFVTDPSAPEAVQVPDAGRGSLDLPIHALSGPTPEQVFSGASDEPVEGDDEDSSDDSEE